MIAQRRAYVVPLHQKLLHSRRRVNRVLLPVRQQQVKPVVCYVLVALRLADGHLLVRLLRDRAGGEE